MDEMVVWVVVMQHVDLLPVHGGDIEYVQVVEHLGAVVAAKDQQFTLAD